MFTPLSRVGPRCWAASLSGCSVEPCHSQTGTTSLHIHVVGFTIDSKKLDHAHRMIYAGFTPFFGLGLDDVHVPTFRLLLRGFLGLEFRVVVLDGAASVPYFQVHEACGSVKESPACTGQIMASSNEVALDSVYCWEDTSDFLTSGFGIIVICPACSALALGRP